MRIILILLLLSNVTFAYNLNNISKFAENICGQIKTAGKEENSKLNLSGNLDPTILSKIGIDIGANGKYSKNNKNYNGLLIKDLPKELQDIRQCKMYILDKFNFKEIGIEDINNKTYKHTKISLPNNMNCKNDLNEAKKTIQKLKKELSFIEEGKKHINKYLERYSAIDRDLEIKCNEEHNNKVRQAKAELAYIKAISDEFKKPNIFSKFIHNQESKSSIKFISIKNECVEKDNKNSYNESIAKKL